MAQGGESCGKMTHNPVSVWRDLRYGTILATPLRMPADSETDRRLARLDQLFQLQRRASVSRVASMIGHLIGTPLQVIHGRAALIRVNPSGDATGEHARRIEEQVERLVLRIRRLIDFLTMAEADASPRAVSELLDETLGLYSPIAIQLNQELVVTAAPEHARVEGASALVVLTSLLSLAMRASAPGDRIELRTGERDNRVVFELDAPGLPPPKARIDLLDPPDNDSGADAERIQVLSVCFDMVRRQSGRLNVKLRDAGGSTIVVEYPSK